MRPKALIVDAIGPDTKPDQLFCRELHKAHRAAEIKLHGGIGKLFLMRRQVHQTLGIIAIAGVRHPIPGM